MHQPLMLHPSDMGGGYGMRTVWIGASGHGVVLSAEQDPKRGGRGKEVHHSTKVVITTALIVGRGWG